MKKRNSVAGLIIADIVLMILAYLVFFENYLTIEWQYILLISMSFMFMLTIGAILSKGAIFSGKQKRPEKKEKIRQRERETKKQLQDEAVLKYLEENPDLKEKLGIETVNELRPTETEIKDISQEEKDEFVEESLQVLHSDFKDNFKDKKNVYTKEKLQEKSNVILPKGKPNKTNVASIESHIDKLKDEKKEQERMEIREKIEERLREREEKQIDETIEENKTEIQVDKAIEKKEDIQVVSTFMPLEDQETQEEKIIRKKEAEEPLSKRQLSFKYFDEKPDRTVDGLMKKYPEITISNGNKYFKRWKKKQNIK